MRSVTCLVFGLGFLAVEKPLIKVAFYWVRLALARLVVPVVFRLYSQSQA